MGRNRYAITEPARPHFLTCTVVEWLPVFNRPAAAKVVLDCWAFQRREHGLRLFGYVILENHLHFIAQADRLDDVVRQFKSFTAKQIIDLLRRSGSVGLLNQLRAAKRVHKIDRDHQLWQEGVHAELMFSEDIMREKFEYIHANPGKRGYVDRPEHWRYSSASNYAGEAGLIEIDRWW